jgi:hypothetical protein
MSCLVGVYDLPQGVYDLPQSAVDLCVGDKLYPSPPYLKYSGIRTCRLNAKGCGIGGGAKPCSLYISNLATSILAG